MKEFTFTWSIENISYSWHKTGEKIISPIFIARPIQNSAWRLSLYPRGFKDSDYLSLFLRRESDSAPEYLEVSFELYCESADTSPLQSCFVPDSLKTFTKVEEYGYANFRFLKRHDVFGRRKALYLPKDTLMLYCRMWIDEDSNEIGHGFGLTRVKLEPISKVDILPEIPRYKIIEIPSNNKEHFLIQLSITFYEDKLDIEIREVKAKLKTSITLNLSIVDKRTETKLCEHEIVWFTGPQNEILRLPFSRTSQCTNKDNSKESNFEFITMGAYSIGEEREIKRDYTHRIPEYLSNYELVPSEKMPNYSSISKDLWNLYNEQILCDVELKTEDRSLFTHKVVLCARSSVFLAMLTGEMTEKENGLIEIEDILANTLEKFLIFLYTDAFEDLEWDEVVALYYAADKYQVKRLKLLCSFYLIKNIDVENVCATLLLAEQHNDRALKRVVGDFIWKDDEKVLKSSLWNEFAKKEPLLAVQTMLSKYQERGKQYFTKIVDEISSRPKFLDDLRSLSQSQTVSDVIIQTASSTYHAHKAVLCACSSIFKDMLSNGVSTDSIQIVDLEDDIVSRMLYFLYTDSIQDIKWDTAKKLYHASDVYQIHRLKFMCSRHLMYNVRISNACDLLLLAHGHSDVRLKSAVENYILIYDEEIFASDKWADLSETNILLANKTMLAKYKKMNCDF